MVVYIPPDIRERMMEAINGAMTPIYPNYDMVFSYQTVNGCWRPLPGSNPHQGEVGKLEETEETRLEFAVREADVQRVVDVILSIHPYEEPGIDIFPFIPGREVAGP